jgi:cytochrome d ubiquinol oxidase subunit I
VAALLQLVTGHSSAEIVARYQPAKLAAMEGHFATNAPADLYLGGWVNTERQQVHGIRVPGGLSWLLHGDRTVPVRGLNDFEPRDRPPVNATFQFYHGMVAIGFAQIGLCLLGLAAWWRGSLTTSPWLLRLFVMSVLGPQIANQLGWFTAEVGRQPWVVYGLLRTSDGLSRVVTSEHIVASLIMFAIVYALLFAVFIYLLHQKIVHGPDEPDDTATARRAIPHLTQTPHEPR